MATRELSRRESPTTLLRQWSDEVDRLLSRRPSWSDVRLWPDLLAARRLGTEAFIPDVEVLTRDGNLVVRADLPGLEQKDITVEVADGVLTVAGERKQEKEEKGDTFYTCERSFGSFSRSIPLPEGVNADQAKATFKNGVLEVTMPAPQVQEKPARRVDVKAS